MGAVGIITVVWQIAVGAEPMAESAMLMTGMETANASVRAGPTVAANMTAAKMSTAKMSAAAKVASATAETTPASERGS